MITVAHNRRLADRLGVTWHVSPLWMRVKQLMQKYPTGAVNADDWLIDITNLRGANIVNRPGVNLIESACPSEDQFPLEEVIVGLCLLGNEDRLQSLRLAAQLISRGGYDVDALVRLVRRERVEPIIGSLALGALRADAHHRNWTLLANAFGEKAARAPLLHWTRLAEPIPDHRHVASGKWRLVA